MSSAVLPVPCVSRLASVQVPVAPTFAAVAGCEVENWAPWPMMYTRLLVAKRTELTFPSGSVAVQSANVVSFFDAGIGVPIGFTFVHVAPPLIERSTWPASPTARPICPPSFWNVMSVSLIELGPKVRVNVPAGCLVKISPFAVTNQKRASDWYSMPVISDDVPDAIGDQIDAPDAAGATMPSTTAATSAA